jgi:CheY-like chemotaxis protein
VNSHVEVIVSDTGLGIRAEFLPYLFERFRQADSTTTRVHGGLGLGLAIAKQIVELHGGRISASSDGEGKGAQFRVELPLTAPNQKIRPEESRIDLADCALDATTLSGVRVLVVDDDPDAREMIRVILSAAGAVVLTAESALEALSVIGAQSPDVLISDLAMPGMDGFELIRRVRALAGPQKNMPATALTAFARSEDRARALRCGFANHLAKPIDPVQLIEAVSSLLQRRTAVGSVSRRELL